MVQNMEAGVFLFPLASIFLAQGDIPEGYGNYPGPNIITNPALKPSLQNFLQNPNPAAFFAKIIPNAIGLAFLIGVIIFLFIMLVGAIQWISSGGDKQALESARGKISNALVGIIILFATFAILKVIEDFFGVNILSLDIGPLIIQ